MNLGVNVPVESLRECCGECCVCFRDSGPGIVTTGAAVVRALLDEQQNTTYLRSAFVLLERIVKSPAARWIC